MLFSGTTCRHRVASSPSPSVPQAAMKPDQVNTDGWNKAWTNLVNDAEQTFTPSVTKLLGVELELVVGNAGAEEDELTLTIMDASGKALANITQRVQTADYARRNLPYEIERRNDVWLEIYSKRIRKRRRNL